MVKLIFKRERQMSEDDRIVMECYQRILKDLENSWIPSEMFIGICHLIRYHIPSNNFYKVSKHFHSQKPNLFVNFSFYRNEHYTGQKYWWGRPFYFERGEKVKSIMEEKARFLRHLIYKLESGRVPLLERLYLSFKTG